MRSFQRCMKTVEIFANANLTINDSLCILYEVEFAQRVLLHASLKPD